LFRDSGDKTLNGSVLTARAVLLSESYGLVALSYRCFSALADNSMSVAFQVSFVRPCVCPVAVVDRFRISCGQS